MSFVINLRWIKNSSRESNILLASICERALVRSIINIAAFPHIFCYFSAPSSVERSCNFSLINYVNLVKEVNQPLSLKIAMLNYSLLLMGQRKHTTKNNIYFICKQKNRHNYFIDEKYALNGWSDNKVIYYRICMEIHNFFSTFSLVYSKLWICLEMPWTESQNQQAIQLLLFLSMIRHLLRFPDIRFIWIYSQSLDHFKLETRMHETRLSKKRRF